MNTNMLKNNISDTLKALSATEKDLLFSKLENAKLINFSGYELASEQKIFWFTHQLNSDSPACNTPAAIMIEGPLNLDVLQRSFEQVIERHDALRTYFTEINGVPYQFTKRQVSFKLTSIDLTNVPKHFIDAELKRLKYGFARRSFDLFYPPLMRATVLQVSPTKNILCFSFHHIVSDGWSLGILLNDLLLMYHSVLYNKNPILPTLTFHYKDYIKWQQSSQHKTLIEKQKNYWKNKLAGISGFLKLPTDYPRPKIRSSQGNFLNVTLSKELSNLIKNFCKAEHTTLNVFFLTAINILLYKYTDEEDIIIGSPIAKREPIETEKLFGLFLNMIVMRTQLKKTESIRTLLKKCRQVAFEAYENGHFPFSDLVELINPPRDPAYTPLFQVMLSNNNAPLDRVQFEELSITPIVNDLGDAYCDLTILYSDTEQGILFSIEYSTELFTTATIELLASHLQSIFSFIIQESDQLLQAVNLLNNEEIEKIMSFSISSPYNHKPNQLLHSLFEDVTINHPDLPALTLGSVSLTYEQLNYYANKLTSLLQDLGIKTQDRVGLFMENSFEAIISMLAISKVGGVYVPLDIRNPQKRLNLIIEDAGLKYILTNKNPTISWQELKDIIKVEVCVDDLKQLANTNKISTNITSDSISYIIYTSGTTGIPNGSMNTHAGIVNTILFRQRTFPIMPQNRVLQLTSFNFDVSVVEVFNCLAAGGELIIVPSKVQTDFGQVINLIQNYQIDILHVVPTVLHNIVNHSDSCKLSSIKQIVAGGEILSTKLAKTVQELVGCEIINGYGPSEAAVYATYAHYKSIPEHVNLGKPLDGVALHILDTNHNIVPIGREGEIYVGGIGLATGYLNRPVLNQERFIDNPYGIGKLFKTGDRGKWNKDGTIEYIGRIDNQIKLRGQRIELGEIEVAIHSLPEVTQSCVLVHQDNSEDKKLVAFIVKNTGVDFILTNVRKELEKYLPHYMIPNIFHIIDNLPMTVNGKVDKQKLRDLISEDKESNKSTLERQHFDEWFYKPSWEKEVLTTIKKRGIANKTILVFSTQNSLVSLLLDRLKKVGANVIEILIGTEYQKLNPSCFVIRPNFKEDYIKLYEDILKSNSSIEYAIHLWSTLIPSSISNINQATELAFYSLLWFAQVMGTYPSDNNIRVFYLTQNLYKVLGTEKIYPFGATGVGLGKVMAQEYPFLTFSSLDYWDLEAVHTPEALINLVLEEICATGTEVREIIAFRENKKYLCTYSLIQKHKEFHQARPLKDKGIYLITGGLGGIGLEIARHIAQTTGSHILLVQRTRLIDEHLWDEILQKKTLAPALLKRITALKEIKKHAASLTVLQGDVSDEKSLLNVANVIGTNYSKLDGIIHAAGIAPQGMIQRKVYDIANNILSPKVHGTINIVNVFAKYEPKFILLCSSLSSIVGGIGLSDYVAANAFLDAFSQVTSSNLISVNWPAWNVGMMLDNSLPGDLFQIQKSILDKGITTSEGIKIFEEVLLQKESHIIVSPQDLVLQINAREDLQDLNLLYGMKTTHTDNMFFNSQNTTTTEAEQIVIKIFKNVLKIETVTRNDHFFELGGHSLLAAQVANRLSNHFGVPIYLQKIFEYPVVSELSRWLEDNKK